MASTTTERNPLQESVFAAMAAKILHAAAELDLPELLAAGPRTCAELADRTDAHAPTLLLDVLMMTVTGGRERTLREFQDLFAVAGLEPAAVTEPIAPFGYRVLEARSNPSDAVLAIGVRPARLRCDSTSRRQPQ